MFFTWGNMLPDQKKEIERILKGVFGRKVGFYYYIAAECSRDEHDHIHAIVILCNKCNITDANLRIKDHSFNYKPARIFKGDKNNHMEYLRK